MYSRADRVACMTTHKSKSSFDRQADFDRQTSALWTDACRYFGQGDANTLLRRLDEYEQLKNQLAWAQFGEEDVQAQFRALIEGQQAVLRGLAARVLGQEKES